MYGRGRAHALPCGLILQSNNSVQSANVGGGGLQAFGLVEVSLESSGSVTGMVTDYWNVLWPLSSSSASVSLVLVAQGAFQPSQVRMVLDACNTSHHFSSSSSSHSSLFQGVCSLRCYPDFLLPKMS